MRIFQLSIYFSLTLTLFNAAASAESGDGKQPDYVKQVAPILTKYCAGCHNSEDREGKLSVETFADLQDGGENGAVFLAGKPSESRLLRMLTGELEPKMPPEDNERPSESEISILRAWIEAGAPGPEGEVPLPTLNTPKIPSRIDGPAPITAIAVSPSGDKLAVARYRRVEIQDAVTNDVERVLDAFPGKVNQLHFSADGSRLVTASGVTGLYGIATLWNLEDGTPIREFQGHRDSLFDAELSPDGSIVATCSYDHQIILWDAETGQALRELEGHNDAVYDIAFNRDGTVLASASGDETIKVWSVSSGERLDTMSQPQAEQYVVKFSPDDRYVLAGGADNRVRVWRFVSKQKREINPLIYSRFAHEGAVVGLAFDGKGSRLVSVGEDRSLKVWEAQQYSQIHLFEAQPDTVSDLLIIPDSNELRVARLDGTLGRYVMGAMVATADGNAVDEVVSAATEIASTNRLVEHEPNDSVNSAMRVYVPAEIEGTVYRDDTEGPDADLFRFASQQGQEWMIEVRGVGDKSPLDSRVEVLDGNGKSIERVMLQAVRDSYFTFRGKDSSTIDDFRLHNWEEMEINEFLYANGEVVKLWHYPRGPDSGFQVYPGFGTRYNYFDTTPMSHALHQPCYIVEPHPPGTQLIPNGLPKFVLYYENDDDSRREWGSDSRMTFRAPVQGEYLIRVVDARGFQGSEFKYQLKIRPRQPDFEVSLSGENPTVNAGGGKEFSVAAKRRDGFEGEIRVDIDNLPPGFHATTPLVIEAGQGRAFGTIFAAPDAPAPTAENAKAAKVTAMANVGGEEVTRPVSSFGEIKLAEKSKVVVRVVTVDDEGGLKMGVGEPVELVAEPGETIMAKVLVERNGFEGRIPFGNADSGRNLPHGVFIDNIGLNGLLIVEGQTERTFFITAAPWVPESTRLFHVRATVEGNQTSLPIRLRIRRPDRVANAEE